MELLNWAWMAATCTCQPPTLERWDWCTLVREQAAFEVGSMVGTANGAAAQHNCRLLLPACPASGHANTPCLKICSTYAILPHLQGMPSRPSGQPQCATPGMWSCPPIGTTCKRPHPKPGSTSRCASAAGDGCVAGWHSMCLPGVQPVRPATLHHLANRIFTPAQPCPAPPPACRSCPPGWG